MVIAVVVAFLNEQEHLPRLLASIARQTRPPDELLLVDDGSTDASPDLAANFADELPYVRLLTRPRQPPQRDRLAQAAELLAFQWAVERLTAPYDVVGKLDADIELTPDVFAMVERELEADPRLGLTGPYLSVVGPDGRPQREHCPPDHIRGATKFYRRRCYEDISPIAPRLGWDTLDEVKARMHGWGTASFEMPHGDPLHLRPTGLHDGVLRSYRRRGLAAYLYGAHPLHVILGAARRLREPPFGIAAVNYLLGWSGAMIRRPPRADDEVRAFIRDEQLGRMSDLVLRRRAR